MTSANPESPHASLDAQARADLAAGRWRQARDVFKQLCKVDRHRFEPLLIEANAGLARAMLAKGLVADAKQVLAYLRSFAPRELIAAMEQEISLAAGAAARPASRADPIELLASGAGTPAERMRWADDLVVAFRDVSAGPGVPGHQAVAHDLAVVHRALEALSAGEADQALELVRPIRRESPFVHWRLFVRAVAAFQTDDPGKAATFFRELPDDSMPGRARRPWLMVLTGESASAIAEPVLEASAAITGHAGWGRALARSDSLWRAGKRAQSYRALRDAQPSFPSDAPDLSGALADFYFNSLRLLPEDERDAFEDHLRDRIADGHTRPAEVQRIRRALAQSVAADLFDGRDARELRSIWEAFVREHERLHGANPRFASAAWTWLGTALSRTEPTMSPVGVAQPIDGNTAIAVLQRAIELDPANLMAHVQLETVYRAMRRTRDRDRLLDVMTKRFPENRDVLAAAAGRSLERKAFAKGAEYLERAVALDPLDHAMADRLATIRLLAARSHYAKRALAKGRDELGLVDGLAVDAPDNLVRGRWAVAARRGVMESLYGDAAAATAALTAARARAPTPARFIFFVRLAWSFYDVRTPFPADLGAELARAGHHEPSVREGIELATIMDYWATDVSRVARADIAWMGRYLESAARAPFTRAEAARVIELARPWGELQTVARTFVRRILKGDRTDPLFRLYDKLLRHDPGLSTDEYEEILAEAQRRGDAAAERMLREAATGPPWLPAAGPDPFGDDDDEAGDFAQLVALLAALPESELPSIRRHKPKGMPRRLFDELIAMARDVRPLPAPRPRSPRRQRSTPKPKPAPETKPEPKNDLAPKPKPAPKTPDPFQADLF